MLCIVCCPHCVCCVAIPCILHEVENTCSFPRMEPSSSANYDHNHHLHVGWTMASCVRPPSTPRGLAETPLFHLREASFRSPPSGPMYVSQELTVSLDSQNDRPDAELQQHLKSVQLSVCCSPSLLTITNPRQRCKVLTFLPFSP